MKNKLIIGRYLPSNSFIHQLDPRSKLIFVFAFIIFIFLCHSFGTYAWLFVLILIIMKMAKINFIFLVKGLTPIFIFLIFTFLMHVFFTKGGTILFRCNFFFFYIYGLFVGIFIFF